METHNTLSLESDKAQNHHRNQLINVFKTQMKMDHTLSPEGSSCFHSHVSNWRDFVLVKTRGSDFFLTLSIPENRDDDILENISVKICLSKCIYYIAGQIMWMGWMDWMDVHAGVSKEQQYSANNSQSK